MTTSVDGDKCGIPSGGGGGASAFTELSDAPAAIVPTGVVLGNEAGDALTMSDVLAILDNGRVIFTTTHDFNVNTDADHGMECQLGSGGFGIYSIGSMMLETSGVNKYIELNATGNVKLQSDAEVVLAAPVYRVYDLPTANPNDAGVLWNDGGTLKISAG